MKSSSFMPRRQRHLSLLIERSMLAFDHHLLDFGDGLRGVQILRAGFGAVHDRMAAIQAERIFEIVQPFAGSLVARIDDPAVCREQGGGPEVAIAVPPVARTGSRAT